MPMEYLASFAVDIDESGVNRLQAILNRNREIAEQASAAFNQAKASMDRFLAGLSLGAQSGLMTLLGNYSSGRNPQNQATAENPSVKDAVKNALLEDLLLGDTTERGYALDTLLLSTVAQGTRNAGDLRNLPTRSDYGLSPAAPGYEDSEDYSSFRYQADEILREPIAKAREIMKEALDAESRGLDTSEYTDKVVEILREPLQQVRELYDSFSFEGDSSGFDLSGLTGQVDAFLQETAKKKLTFDTSPALSQSRNLLASVRAMFANTSVPLNIRPAVSGAGTSLASGLIASVLSYTPGAGARQVTNNNSQASVNINVTSNAADPVAVGQSVYDTAERYLLRTLQTVG